MEPVRIKKYPNRRFYDATHSRHVTLADLHEMVKGGQQIVVTDSRNDQDITSAVLTQILLEHASERLDLFPADLLHHAIQANQQMVTRFMRDYFANAIDAFSHSREQFDRFLTNAGLSPMSPSTPLDWAQMFMRSFSGEEKPARTSSTHTEQEPPTTQQSPEPPQSREPTLTELQQKVDALSAELDRLRQDQPARKTRSKQASSTRQAKPAAPKDARNLQPTRMSKKAKPAKRKGRK